MRFMLMAAASAVACVLAAGAARAQEAAATATVYVDSKSPFFPASAANAEAASVKMPELSFKPTPEDASNYDKYFYFTRTETDFATAYADIVECDGYARGLASGVAPSYGQGILGDALANAMGDLIYGSANRRKLRRKNLRACMAFKGYERHGLSKDVWSTFNFEEGNKSIDEDARTAFLKQQALVASSARPQDKALGL